MAPHAAPDHAIDAALPDAGASAKSLTTAKSSRAAWVGFALLLSASMSVFWAFDALPFQDLPAHAGLIAMRHRFSESAFEQRFFVLAPHIGPYSLFRFLGECFVRVIGPVPAVRAIASLPVIATPLALSFARRRLFGDRAPHFAFLGLALSFGLMTLLGFASYLLGVAVMLVALTLWLELAGAADRGEPTRRRALVVAIFSPLVFVAHGHAFLLYLFFAGVSCLAATHRARVFWRLPALLPAIALAGWVAWIERGGTRPAGSAAVGAQNLAPHFQGLKDKASLLLTPTLMTRSGVDLLVGVAIWVFVVAAVFVSIRRASELTAETPSAAFFAKTLRWGALGLFVLFAALPHSIGWFGFVDGRLVPIVLFAMILSIRREALSRMLRVALERGAPVCAAAIVAIGIVASYRFQDEARGYREVLAKVPAGAHLLNLPLDPDSDIFAAHPFVHYDKLVLAERPVVVSDVWFHQGSALYPTAENPSLRLPSTYSESDLKFVDWPRYDMRDWDYVLMRTRPSATSTGAPASFTLKDHRGGFWLYATN